MVASVYEYYIGFRPLSEVYFMYTIFQELALLLSSGNWQSYWQFLLLFIVSVAVVENEPGTFSIL